MAKCLKAQRATHHSSKRRTGSHGISSATFSYGNNSVNVSPSGLGYQHSRCPVADATGSSCAGLRPDRQLNNHTGHTDRSCQPAQFAAASSNRSALMGTFSNTFGCVLPSADALKCLGAMPFDEVEFLTPHHCDGWKPSLRKTRFYAMISGINSPPNCDNCLYLPAWK